MVYTAAWTKSGFALEQFSARDAGCTSCFRSTQCRAVFCSPHRHTENPGQRFSFMWRCADRYFMVCHSQQTVADPIQGHLAYHLSTLSSAWARVQIQSKN